MKLNLKSRGTKRTVVWTASLLAVSIGAVGATYFICNKDNSTPNTAEISLSDALPSSQPADGGIVKTKEIIEGDGVRAKRDIAEEGAESAKIPKNTENHNRENSERLPAGENPTAQKRSENSKAAQDKPASFATPSKDYSHLYPELYAERPKNQVSPEKTIFLTFDDGPSARTAEVLDILKQNDIKATFFVIGNRSAEGKALMKRIVDEGHTIAPHSYTHEFKQIYASVEAFLDDFNKIYSLIYETTGVKPTIFRFAGGSKNGFNKDNYREIIAEMVRRGFDYFDWNLSTGDAVRRQLTPAVTCISNVTKNSAKQDSAVVLMHDAAPKTTTVEALPGLIEELRAQGFKFDKLSGEIDPSKYSLIKPYA